MVKKYRAESDEEHSEAMKALNELYANQGVIGSFEILGVWAYPCPEEEVLCLWILTR